jgi:hypothetical protein
MVARRGLLILTTLLLVTSAVACGTDDPGSRKAGVAAGPNHPNGAEAKIPLRNGERFQYLSMERPFTPTPPSGATDEYRCFLLDPHFPTSSWIIGTEFLPQNADIVHHAILFRVQARDVPATRKLDDATPGDGWTCFGDAGIKHDGLTSTSSWIGSWAPGSTEALVDANVGFEMQAGSRIIMQVHYNLLATDGKAPGPDRSGVRLRVMNGSVGLTPLQTTLLPAPVELPCPPTETGPLCDRRQSVADLAARFGEQARRVGDGLNALCNRGVPKPGTTQTCDHPARQDAVVHGVAGHMHLLGRSIKVERNPGTPGAQTLLGIPVYNFDDQSARPTPQPVTVKAGDTYRVTCTHDATLRAQLPQLKPLKPRYVVWGEGTADEMCLGIVIWSKP